MAVRYNKLWKILIDKKMKKKDLQEAAHITHYQMMKLARDENITTEIIGNICKALTVRPMKSWSFMTHKLSRVCFM